MSAENKAQCVVEARNAHWSLSSMRAWGRRQRCASQSAWLRLVCVGRCLEDSHHPPDCYQWQFKESPILKIQHYQEQASASMDVEC